MNNFKSDVSFYRKQILNLLNQIKDLLSIILSKNSLIKGTIYDQKKKCGNPNCKCARGELHITKLLSFSDKGKTKLIPLTKYSYDELLKIRQKVKSYQQFRKSRAGIVKKFKLLIRYINELETNLKTEILMKKGEKDGKKRPKKQEGND